MSADPDAYIPNGRYSPSRLWQDGHRQNCRMPQECMIRYMQPYALLPSRPIQSSHQSIRLTQRHGQIYSLCLLKGLRRHSAPHGQRCTGLQMHCSLSCSVREREENPRGLNRHKRILLPDRTQRMARRDFRERKTVRHPCDRGHSTTAYHFQPYLSSR